MVQPYVHLPASLPPRLPARETDLARAMRRHLQAVMDDAGLQIADLVRMAGIRSNTLYNFMGGDTGRLAAETIWALVKHLPRLDLNIMLGVPAGLPRLSLGAPVDGFDPAELAADLARVPAGDMLEGKSNALGRQSAVLRMHAEPGVLRSSVYLPEEERAIVGLPILPEIDVRIFAVRVGGAGGLYPAGTLLGCTPVREKSPIVERIAKGRRVILVRRHNHSKRAIEVTVRQIEMQGPKKLGIRGDRASGARMLLPQHFTGAPWDFRGDQMHIVALVELSCLLERDRVA